MNNPMCVAHVAPILGRLRNASFLRSCLAFRVTRTQLLVTGRHIDLSTLAAQAGFQIPVFFRREVFDCLTDSANFYHASKNDLYEAMCSLRQAMMKAPIRDCPVLFQVGDFTLVAQLGGIDHDDPRPSITVSLSPNQD